jgi:hypothetical protein
MNGKKLMSIFVLASLCVASTGKILYIYLATFTVPPALESVSFTAVAGVWLADILLKAVGAAPSWRGCYLRSLPTL